MTSSSYSPFAHVPPSNVPSTGPFNIEELLKFGRLVGFWITAIFVPVWLASWAIGELLPFIIYNATSTGDNLQVGWRALIETLQALVPVIAVMVFIPINAMFMVLLERRGLALFTVRKGPNRVGPDGLFQTAADAVKLLFKEDITPTGADAAMFTLAPILFFAPSIFGAIPLLAAVTNLHPLFMQTNLPTGIFYVLAMSAIPVVALVMGGWASNNKYSLVGGLRSAAQAISYEIPLVLSLVTICYLMGTLDLVQIAFNQAANTGKEVLQILSTQAMSPVDVFHVDPANVPMSPGLMKWNVMGCGILQFNPFDSHAWYAAHAHHFVSYFFGSIALVICCWILMFVYMTGACAEINRIPFDLPEAESELVSGYNTEYSGIKFAIFFLAEFTNLFIVATITTVMFLGAGTSPIPGFLDAHMFAVVFNAIGQHLPITEPKVWWLLGSLLNPVTLSAWLWVVIKVYTLVFIAVLVRGTLPRFRIDQLMDFGWKRLIPLTLVVFVAVAFLKEVVR